ncbi:hypothetical protein R69658_05388 [Paraburkholderia aspalathi]|uniref:Phage tail collar domain-containing protein n=1 Tax=Paraburkholderia aspalathi TaxID=1324617 RepID=A0ABN7MJM0_9BURK|nr:phage tail protein [Paraburkholderia aspalathi]MBK3833631.1 phage tail protein [Paraburkholderia aspalathi]MBK3863354.1 phage tail protein [Paraburkholderia aspalathi]CAE6810705.1 hypothetical protein R69658_05388 [Paraburkholderia aspalathi]
MANLVETAQWEEGVYQLETSDPVVGGPDGIDNRQARQLGNRTLYLKQRLDQAQGALEGHVAAADPHPQYAPKISPVLTGQPKVPTAPAGDNSQLAANTAFVAAALAALVNSSPAALDTLRELADALGDDPDFAVTMTNALALKAPLKSPEFTDIPKAPTGTAGDSSRQLSTNEFVQVAIGAGHIAFFARNTAPAGYLKANGAAVSRTIYPVLFASIGTTFGAGDGATTFNLPDLRGEFLRGWDDSRGVDSGRTFGALQTDAFRSHTHGVQIRLGLDDSNFQFNQGFSSDACTDGGKWQTDPTGGTETRPRNVALLACIKY